MYMCLYHDVNVQEMYDMSKISYYKNTEPAYLEQVYICTCIYIYINTMV